MHGGPAVKAEREGVRFWSKLSNLEVIGEKLIIESVDSICRDSTDTQYMLIQTNLSKSPKQLSYKPLYYNTLPFIFECFHDEQHTQWCYKASRKSPDGQILLLLLLRLGLYTELFYAIIPTLFLCFLPHLT